MRPAIFLEKDRTLLEEPAESSDRRIRLRPRAVDALLLLSGLGYELFVIGNQPGVARGLFPPGTLDAVAVHLDDIFLTHGFKLRGCYWCPHDPAGSVMDFAFECACRKPLPGLIQAAARDHHIDLSRSWAIGCDVDDIEAGMRAGCNTVWIGEEDDIVHRSLADLVAHDLLDAAAKIMRAQESRSSHAPLYSAAWTTSR